MASPMILARTSGGTTEGLKNSVTIGVADEHVGAVVGRAGKNIMEISQVSVSFHLKCIRKRVTCFLLC